jgi:CRISPR system Cascade subunit CasD
MSFGSPMVDHLGVIQPFPALSMLTGILGNALGWDHRNFERLDRLQESIRYASRADQQGRRITDYQTVDLDRDHMRARSLSREEAARGMLPSVAWTTWGRPIVRAGDSAAGTHQRYRDYWADAIHTVALSVDGNEHVTNEEVVSALKSPARPLFLGRKCCLPARPVLLRTASGTLLSALARVPDAGRASQLPLHWPAWWFEGEPAAPARSVAVPVTDERDWRNQVHVGRRTMRHGLLPRVSEEVSS